MGNSCCGEKEESGGKDRRGKSKPQGTYKSGGSETDKSDPKIKRQGDKKKNQTEKTPSVTFEGDLPVEEQTGKINVIFDKRSKTAEISVGFLKEGESYEITFNIMILAKSQIRIENSNTKVRIQEIRANKNGHDVVIHIEPLHQKRFNDQLKIFDASTNNKNKNNDIFLLNISASVLHKGQGTPFLKNGVRCIAAETQQVGGSISAEDAKFRWKSSIMGTTNSLKQVETH